MIQKTNNIITKISIVLLVFFVGVIILVVERFWQSNGLLYEQIVYAAFASTIFFVSLRRILPLCTQITPKFQEVAAYFLIGALLFYSFGFSVVMTVDRSKSLYVLNWVHQTQPTNMFELGKSLEKKYGSYDKVYIEQRIKEQIERGVFSEQEQEIRLTEIGTFFWNSANLTAKIFNLNGWHSSKFD